MNIKRIASYLLSIVFGCVFTQALAQEAVISDCGDECLGHVFDGKESIRVISGLHRIELNGAYIDVAEQNNTAAFLIEHGAEVILTLENENVLKSGNGCAGLQVPYGAALTIAEASTGKLDAIGGMKAAGIGGGFKEDSGTIMICGGFVNAKGKGDYSSEGGAGIGGGYDGSGDEITISGGVVNATGGLGAAGIGGGYNGSGGDISITGGIVNADTPCEYISGAGIGGGAYGYGGRIDIRGGIVSAYTGYCEGHTTGAGIGGGMDGSNGSVAIYGGVIYASAGSDAAGIGASGTGWNGSIEINGGFVTALGGEWGGAGIGGKGSFDSDWDNGIRVAGGVTIAKGGHTQSSNPSGAGIGGFGGVSNPFIGITAGYVHATAGAGGNCGGAGIGSGGFANANAILIEKGRIIAIAGEDDETGYGGAGIGSGGNGLANDIVILGGKITAKGRGAGAGIGNGERKQVAIQIDGGLIETCSGNTDDHAIIGNLEYARGEVNSNGEILCPNMERIDYAIWPSWYY